VLYNKIPFLRICVPLIAGIIVAYFFRPQVLVLVITGSAILFGFIVSLFFNDRLTNIIFGSFFFAAVFTTGIILFTLEMNSISVLTPRKTLFCAIIKDYPEKKGNSVMVQVKLKEILDEENPGKVKGSLILYHNDESVIPAYSPGDILILRCTPLEIKNSGNPDEFDYRFYMERRDTRYYAFTGRADIISHIAPGRRNLKYLSLMVRENIIKMYEKRGISGDHLAIVAAVTLGEKSLLDSDQKQNFIKAGVTHIMAVSGLHAIILSMFVFNILFFMKGRLNPLRIIITILVLWAFAFITGLTPSVMRAALMFTFFQAGQLMNRRVNGIRPSVIFEAGFLLSFTAVIYIIGFYRELHDLFWFRNPVAEKIWQSVAVTLVAQAGTLPLVIMFFNRFPVWFILTNVVIVPLAAFLIIGSCLVPLTFPVVFLSDLAGNVVDKLAGLIEMLTAGAARLPLSTIENIGITPIECLFLSLSISLSLYWLLKKPSISIKYPLAAILLFSLSLTITRVYNGRHNELIVYNTPGNSTIGIRTGNVLNIYSAGPGYPRAVLRHSSVRRLKVNYIELKPGPMVLKTGNGAVMITDSIAASYVNRGSYEVIILTGPDPYISPDIPYNELPDTKIIVTQGYSSYLQRRQSPGSLADRAWSVKKSGACMLALDSYNK
jgi:competence protein ComEC